MYYRSGFKKLPERQLCSWAKTYAEGMVEGNDYDQLKRTIVVNIMAYNAIHESSKLHTHFKLLEREEGFILTEDLQIHYLELPKLPQDKKIEELEGVEIWIAFLKEAGRNGSEEKLKKLRERSESMSKAMESLEAISTDERMLELHRAREKARMDELAKIAYAERQKAKQIAEEMFKLGLGIEVIEKATKLSLEELKEIENIVKQQSN